MQAVADLVDEKSVADIGCDHARVAMWLAENGVNRVIAMDVKQGPLDIAKSNIRANNMDDVISVRLSDGMEALDAGEVECAIIAGMGGALITQILSRGIKKLEQGIHLILQPQSEVHKVRRFILQNGYIICNERMLVEDGKFYNVIKAVPGCEEFYSEKKAAPEGGKTCNTTKGTSGNGHVEGGICHEAYSALDVLYGKLLLAEKNPVLKTYLDTEKDKLTALKNSLEEVYTETAVHRLKEINEELTTIEEALENYYAYV